MSFFVHPWKDGTYYGMALSVHLSTIACEHSDGKRSIGLHCSSIELFQ